MKVTNLHTQPITLADGTILAAARTEGSTKNVADLDERDVKRLVRRELISVREDELKAVESPKPKVQSAQPVEKEN